MVEFLPWDCCTWSGVTCDEVSGHVIRLDLACSGLVGIIHSNNSLLPAEYFGNFTAMMDAHSDVFEYMGRDQLCGSYYFVTMTIKGNFMKLPKIQRMFMTIDFSSNNFTGEIPKLIRKLNSLKGHIPVELAAALNQLAVLNLSNNRLEGPIPRGKQFETFNSDSYGGNLGLCGFPLPKSCSTDEAQQGQGNDDGEHESGMTEWKVVMMGYASGMVIGISVGYMVFFRKSFDYWFFKRFGGGRCCRTNTRSRGRRRSN